MHYDGAGPGTWLASLATSTDLTNWTKLGPVLGLGGADDDDSASASYGTTFFDGTRWHMFYVATRFVTPAPDFIPATPYLTMKAIGHSPLAPGPNSRRSSLSVASRELISATPPAPDTSSGNAENT